MGLASFLESEASFAKTHRLLHEIATGEHAVIVPLIVLVEVSAAIYRRTQDNKLTDHVVQVMLRLPGVEFVEMDYKTTLACVEFTKRVGLKASDTIVVFTALKYQATLATLDGEMQRKAALHVGILEF